MSRLIQNLGQTFPTHGTIFTFITYICLFVFQGILMRISQTSKNTYEYSTIAAVLITELVKLLVSIVWYLRDNPITSFTLDLRSNIKLFGLYLIPSALYCIYNNLTYVNLRTFDPTTYNLLLQFRVVITGLIYQCFFRQKLTKWQWLSLIVLTLGCAVKNLGTHGTNEADPSTATSLIPHLFLLTFQLCCSCVAGVFNEYLLKIPGASLDIGMHNIFMYIDSFLCNLVALICFTSDFVESVKNPEPKYPTAESFFSLLRPSVVIVIINNAACGIVTSIFLKKLNSILKTFASAVELILVACLCWILFAIPVDVFTIISFAIIFYAIYLQLKHPIKFDLKSSHPVSSVNRKTTGHELDRYSEFTDFDEPTVYKKNAETV